MDNKAYWELIKLQNNIKKNPDVLKGLMGWYNVNGIDLKASDKYDAMTKYVLNYVLVDETEEIEKKKEVSEVIQTNTYKFEYCSNTGWKSKFLVGTLADLQKYIDRYHKNKKVDYKTLSESEIKSLKEMYPNSKFIKLN